ncbi:hypothetical protein [Bradyrhizobium sp.]|nr:hypothetical protein [Bradyrhizobium sp.]
MTELSLDAASEAGDYQAAIAALQRMAAELAARVAQLEQPPASWLPLKAAAIDAGVEYETARQWVVRGLVEGRREGERWLVNVVSLKARKQQFAGLPWETKLTT